MFSFFPNTYVIIMLFFLSGYFYNRFDYWLRVAYDIVGPEQHKKKPRKYSRYNLLLFSVFLMAAITLSIIDCVMSVYVIE